MTKLTNLPIHKLAQEALYSLGSLARAQGITLEILADPELTNWYTPYPDTAKEIIATLGKEMLRICPKGVLTVMIQPANEFQDTFRVEIQMEVDASVVVDIDADFSLAVLETDNLSPDINLLGIDSPNSSQYILGYDVHLPLIKEPKKTGMLSQWGNLPDQDTYANLRVLVVDDNEVNRMVVSKFLSRWGMHVDQAVDGEGAVNRFRVSEYDVVLMDLEMPVMDGYQATQNIRKMEVERKAMGSVPIIALTAFSMVEARDRAYASGMNDFLSKPLDPPTLYSKIVTLLNRPQAQASA